VSTELPQHGLAQFSADLLNEAEHLYHRELLVGSSTYLREHLIKVRWTIERARSIQTARPGSAASLALAALDDLNELYVARGDTPGG
jgi:hypothetical protein